MQFLANFPTYKNNHVIFTKVPHCLLFLFSIFLKSNHYGFYRNITFLKMCVMLPPCGSKMHFVFRTAIGIELSDTNIHYMPLYPYPFFFYLYIEIIQKIYVDNVCFFGGGAVFKQLINRICYIENNGVFSPRR